MAISANPTSGIIGVSKTSLWNAWKEVRASLHTASVRDVIDKFYGDNGRYPETLEELVEKKYLRALPVDPITESAATWQLVPVPEGYKGTVYDVHSGAQGMDRDGKKYADW